MNTVNDNNFTTLYGATFIDMNFADYNFHFQQNSPAIDVGLSQNAPTEDIEKNPRPYGNGFGLGAYEYSLTSSIDEPHSNQNALINIYPNPAKTFVNFDLKYKYADANLEVYNILGKKIIGRNSQNINKVYLP